MPLPGLASPASAVLSTVKPAAPVVLGLKLAGPSRVKPNAMISSAAPAVPGYETDVHEAPASRGGSTATWTFTSLPAGEYSVSATWTVSGRGASSKAPYLSLGTSEVSQICEYPSPGSPAPN